MTGTTIIALLVVFQTFLLVNLEKHTQYAYQFDGLLRAIEPNHFKSCTQLYFVFENETEKNDIAWLDEFLDLRLNSDLIEPRQIYMVGNETNEMLQSLDLNLITKCPVYISLSKNIMDLVDFLQPVEKDWDKYIYSRKHIIYTESSLNDIETFLNLNEMNTLSNLLICSYDKASSSTYVFSNIPFTTSLKKVDFVTVFDGKTIKGLDNVFSDKLRNFNQYPMKVGTFNFPPRIFMSKNPVTEEYDVRGLDIALLQTIAEALNISLIFNIPSDGNLWGWETDNGSWTGLIGDLQTRKIHIGVADLFVMEPYFAACDLSVEYDIEYLCSVNPSPGPYHQAYALILPFSMETWSFFLLFVGLGMFTNVILAIVGQQVGIKESPWFNSVSNNTLLMSTCVFNVSWVREPKTSHMRVLIIISTLSFLVLGFAYKGSLMSYLTIPLIQPPIDTNEQLYKKGIDVGSIGSTFKNIMQKNADPFVRKLSERYVEISTMEEGFKMTESGTFSLIESRGFLKYTIAAQYTDSLGREKFHVMKDYIAPFGVAAAFPKYVSYIAKFNTVIRRVTEAGLPIKWLSDLILRGKAEKTLNPDEAGKDESGSGETGTALSLGNLQGAFFIYLVGLLSAMMVFLCEVIWKRCKS